MFQRENKKLFTWCLYLFILMFYFISFLFSVIFFSFESEEKIRVCVRMVRHVRLCVWVCVCVCGCVCAYIVFLVITMLFFFAFSPVRITGISFRGVEFAIVVWLSFFPCNLQCERRRLVKANSLHARASAQDWAILQFQQRSIICYFPS